MVGCNNPLEVISSNSFITRKEMIGTCCVHPANIHASKVNSVSDEQLNLAKQNSHETDYLSNEPSLASPVYDDAELVRRAQQNDNWAIEQLVMS